MKRIHQELMELSAEELEELLREARERGARAIRATAVHYDPVERKLVLTLKDGREVKVPVDRLPWLQGVSDEALAKVKLTPAGSGVYWEELDVDLGVEGLLREVEHEA